MCYKIGARAIVTESESSLLWEDDEWTPVEMAWTKIAFSRQEINEAGKALVAYEQMIDFDHGLYFAYMEALPIINNWRSTHSFPLNTFRINLNRSSARTDQESVTAQRIKRLSSIGQKLIRFQNMKLSQMQDIGGCRAVLKSVERVNQLYTYYKDSQVKHKIIHADNYIDSPKNSGYRGIHLIWRYHSDRSEDFNDLKIEMQLRSTIQHAWATAVETVGTFVRQALKSSQGEEEWLRFFALMGTVVAFKEQTPPVQGTPTNRKELIDELSALSRVLDVQNRLSAFGMALQVLEEPSVEDAAYYLLEISPAELRVVVTGFKFGEFQEAANKYLEVEKNIPVTGGKDAVLVSVKSVAALKRAYPNYFADTRVFADLVRETLEEPSML
jgi:ppGpp synthetase/RelA/SpoT-type nucleotidyltranferase